MRLKRIYVLFLQKLQLFSGLSIKLTKLTGKSKYQIHPKHLLNSDPWYQKFLKNSDILLDIGSGSGQHSINASAIVKKVIGFDLTPQVVEIASKRLQDGNVKNVKFEVGNSEKRLPFRDNFFSAVFCLDVLEHLKNQALAMREIKRVLKPKGKFFLSLPNSQTSWKKLQKGVGLFYFSDPDHKREYTRKEIETLCKKFGFEIKFINPVTLDTPFAGLFDLIGGFSLSLYKIFDSWKRRSIVRQPEESVGYQILAINNKA